MFDIGDKVKIINLNGQVKMSEPLLEEKMLKAYEINPDQYVSNFDYISYNPLNKEGIIIRVVPGEEDRNSYFIQMCDSSHIYWFDDVGPKIGEIYLMKAEQIKNDPSVSKRFDLEAHIMDSWSTADDLLTLSDNIINKSENWDIDRIVNALNGLAILHEAKSDRLFDTFSDMIESGEIS